MGHSVEVRSRTRLPFVPIDEISVDELASLPPGTFVLDVRNPDEHAEMRVPGAVLIPLPELDSRVDELPRVESVYVICRSGARSAKAAELLGSKGISAVNVTGGTLAWIDSGRVVESGPVTD